MAYKRCLITNNNPVQLLDKSKYPATTTKEGITFTNNGDGSFTANGTSTGNAQIYLCSINAIETHKYLLYGSSNGVIFAYSDGKFFYPYIFTPGSIQLYIYIKAGDSGSVVSNLVFKPQLFDLTEMFGAGNEPTTVAEFRALYPNELYPYNPTNCVTSYKKMMKVSDVCQLIKKDDFPESKTINGITFTNNRDGTITVDGTNSSGSNVDFEKIVNGTGYFREFSIGHKFLILGNPGSGQLYIQGRNSTSYNPTAVDYGKGRIFVYDTEERLFSIWIRIPDGTTVSNAVFKPQLFDLTEMYGAGNEPTTVAAFREKFPNEMYPYSPQCFVTAYKNNMVAKTKNLWTCDKPAPNNEYQYDSSNQVFKINKTLSLSCYTLPTPIPAGTTLSISVHFLSGILPDNGNFAVGGYHNEGTNSWQGLVNLYGSSYWGIDLTGKTFTSTSTTTDTLNDFWIYAYPIIPENMQFKVQLELGSTATDYVPYGYL